MIKYQISKKKRTIIAMFNSNWKNRLYSTVYKIFGKEKFSVNISDIINKILKSYTKGLFAKAKCNPGDAWNEEYGKALAKDRLLKKWNTLVNRILQEAHWQLEYNYKDTCLRIDKAMVKNNEKIKRKSYAVVMIHNYDSQIQRHYTASLDAAKDFVTTKLKGYMEHAQSYIIAHNENEYGYREYGSSDIDRFIIQKFPEDYPKQKNVEGLQATLTKL